jgi:PAS domain S-box-containing protein
MSGLLASLAVIGWETRRQGRAALDAERRLAAAEAVGRAELEELVRCSPALLYRGRLDPLSQYSRVYATPNSLAITGWTAEELANPDKAWSHVAEEDQHLRRTNYARAHREGRAAVDYRFVRPDGGYSWLRNEMVVIRDYTDGSADVVGAVTNVTREHEMAAQSAQMNRMATLGEIATSIAHELSQPVTVITMAASYAQSLADEMGGAGELGRQIDAILTQGERAGDIIRHLRSYGHAEGGAMGAVDLRQAVAGAMVLAGQPLAEAMVAVEVEWPADLPMVRGRLVQVEQVLLNLFINARDAMREVSDTRRHLRIFTEVSDAGVEMHVADSGPGVPTEVMPRLFEPFFTTKAMGEGTGLGLSLCRTMMEGFGGAISARNGDLGSVFSLHFAVAEEMPETG